MYKDERKLCSIGSGWPRCDWRSDSPRWSRMTRRPLQDPGCDRSSVTGKCDRGRADNIWRYYEKADSRWERETVLVTVEFVMGHALDWKMARALSGNRFAQMEIDLHKWKSISTRWKSICTNGNWFPLMQINFHLCKFLWKYFHIISKGENWVQIFHLSGK